MHQQGRNPEDARVYAGLGFPEARSYATRSRSAAALFRLAAAMSAGAWRVFAAARRLDAWCERKRIAAAALRDFGTMSERELLDIGLTRVDVHRVAWGASDRAPNRT
ncbi:MAG: hypothetical protein ACREYB_00760 [Casimicrobiaceae bacterium]